MRGVWPGLLQYLWIVQTPASPNEPLSFAKRPQPPRFSKKTKKTNTTSHHTKHPQNPNQALKRSRNHSFSDDLRLSIKKFIFGNRDHLLSQNVKICARIFQCWFQKFSWNRDFLKITRRRESYENLGFFEYFQKIGLFSKIKKNKDFFRKFSKKLGFLLKFKL